MSERYSRLFALPEDLYCVGSPVVIAAGALLKDNQTGKVIGQLKLRSISPKTIKAVKVKLNLFDTAGNPIGESVAHTYLDLNARRNEEFGQKSPVAVAESQTRSYQASVTEVVFEDQSVWAANEGTWEPLAKPVALSITDPELLKQYQMHYGTGAKYAAKAEKDLWHCTCGALNHEGENCHRCGHSLFELQTVDMEKLAAEKDARRAEAARKAAEEQSKANAIKKKVLIALAAVCIIVTVPLMVTKVIIPNSKYNNAVSLMEAEQYEEAIAAFEAMDGYKDSVQMIDDCELAIKYNDAIALMDLGSYEEAISVFEAADGYKDSVQKIEDCENAILEGKYIDAVALMEAERYDEAIVAFKAIEDYKDSAAQIKACNTAIMDGKYNDAVALIETDVVQAYEALIALDSYKDSAEKASSIYEEYKITKRNNAQVGDYILFGSYEQDNNTVNGKEDVEWLVLDKDGDRLLLISRYALRFRGYGSDWKHGTWETSKLRGWLNDTFINDAFSNDEQALIVETTINNPTYWASDTDTRDRIFLLSTGEAWEYFASEEARQCTLTEYAYAIDSVIRSGDNDFCLWWLRTPGSYDREDACTVESDGHVNSYGSLASAAGVRPTLWINIEP